MRTQDSATNKDASSGLDVSLRELTSSMIRFSNAVTLFSMQQMQNALGAVTDSQALINRFCGALDAISNTLSTQIDAAKKSTLDSMTPDWRRDGGPHHGLDVCPGAEPAR